MPTQKLYLDSRVFGKRLPNTGVSGDNSAERRRTQYADILVSPRPNITAHCSDSNVSVPQQTLKPSASLSVPREHHLDLRSVSRRTKTTSNTQTLPQRLRQASQVPSTVVAPNFTYPIQPRSEMTSDHPHISQRRHDSPSHTSTYSESITRNQSSFWHKWTKLVGLSRASQFTNSRKRHTSQKKIKKTTGQPKQLWLSRALVAAAFLLLIGGGYVIVDGYRTNRKVAAQATKIEHVIREDAAKETAPTPPTNQTSPPTASSPTKAVPASAYQVPADQPKYLDIPKIKVHARVTVQGIDKNGAVAVPTNTSRTGWYTNSARPGQSGAALIIGHVSSYGSYGGVFYNLKKLEAGDTITVTMGDDKTHTYTVIAKKAIPKDAVDMTEALTPIQLDKPGLNLMTCYGTFDSKEKTYDQRLLVYASLQ